MKLTALVLLLAAYLLQSFAAAAPPSKTPALAPLAWYDANGKLVGRSATPTVNENVSWLAMPWGEDLVPVQLTNSSLGFGGAEFQPRREAYFSAPNCTGTAYLHYPPIGSDLLGYRRVAAAVVQPDGLTLYVSVRDPIPVQRLILSAKNATQACSNVVGPPLEYSLLDTEGSMNLTGQFALPLYLK